MPAQQTEVQPILGKGGRTAEWVRVDQKLIDWVKKMTRGRRVFKEFFNGVSVPCENGCEKNLEVGELALMIRFHGEPVRDSNQTKKDRVFCSVACQRQNYFDNPQRFQRKR